MKITMFTLRPYQQAAVDAVIKHITTRLDSCVVDAAPAAGKSFMVAAVAKFINDRSGKRVLCLAPTKELIEQNHEKYLLTGEKASIFSASLNLKQTKHPVIFGAPQTVKNSLSRFIKGGYAAVIVDECHGITPTIKTIISALLEVNTNLRVIGLTGTPYRLGTGYIYSHDENDKPLPQDQIKDPYFSKLVYRVSAQEMLDQGFITPMDIGSPLTEAYDTSGLLLNRMGKYDSKEVDRAFVGHGRKTAAIVDDVLQQSHGKGGVMFFAATVQHAEEIIASLPPDKSGIVTGETTDRDQVIKDYKSGRKRYIVSVGTLTTGFDAPYTEVIALLRKTESASLLQQMMGRAWRLYEGKERSLLLDYAQNVETHFPDGDIYSPVIKVQGSGSSEGTIPAQCGTCGTVNEFSARKNNEQYEYDEEGYFIDLTGARIEHEGQHFPAHYGRRCMGLIEVSKGKYDQCTQRWSSKSCGDCGEDNDIAARYCTSCRGELVDPNEKLIMEFKALKRSPYNKQTDIVTEYNFNESMTQSGKECYRVNFKTPYRSFTVWIMKSPINNMQLHQKELWMALKGKPETVTYKKEQSGFYRLFAFNEKEDALENTT